MSSQYPFSEEFLIALRGFVGMHHALYRNIPPRDIFFESLDEGAFKRIKKPFTRIETTLRNVPKHDLVVGDEKISLKSETGAGTKENLINITKLCTTERDP